MWNHLTLRRDGLQTNAPCLAGAYRLNAGGREECAFAGVLSLCAGFDFLIFKNVFAFHIVEIQIAVQS